MCALSGLVSSLLAIIVSWTFTLSLSSIRSVVSGLMLSSPVEWLAVVGEILSPSCPYAAFP